MNQQKFFKMRSLVNQEAYLKIVERKILAKKDPRLEQIKRLQQYKLKPLFLQPHSARLQTQFTSHLANFNPNLPGITTEDLKKNQALQTCREKV